jgi:anti-sigma-K factor RskA
VSTLGADHEQMKDLIAPYVLGATDREEASMVRSHISSCDECMAEADHLAQVAGTLALAVEDVPLPSGFADRVLSEATGREAGQEKPAASRARRRWSLLPALAGAALLLVVAVMSVSLVQTRTELNQKERALTAMLHEDTGLNLRGTGASGKMVPTSDGSYFVVAGLHQAPDNHTYQLWLLRDGEPTSAGTFDVTDGVALIETDLEIDQFDAAAVTVEPAGGSPGPTSDPILISS